MEFESASPSVVKSIRQRELLNGWLALYARSQSLPQLVEYRPERLDEEKPDLVHYSVEADIDPPRLVIQSEGTRMASAYGHAGKGRALDSYVGPRLAPFVMPAYYQCVRRRLPVYTIVDIDDIYGRVVAYERLLMDVVRGNPTLLLILIAENCSDPVCNQLAPLEHAYRHSNGATRPVWSTGGERHGNEEARAV